MPSILRINGLKFGAAVAALVGLGMVLLIASGVADADGGRDHGPPHGNSSSVHGHRHGTFFHGHGPQHGPPPPFHGHVPQPKTLVVDGGTVIWNVTVVSTEDGSLDPDSIVVIKEGKIGTITSVKWTHLVLQNGAKFVNGSGKYLVPGYNNMHVHAIANAGKEPTQWALRLAAGETGIMDMGSKAAGEALNKEVAEGLDAPEDLFRVGFPTVERHLQFPFVPAITNAREAVLNYGYTEIDHLGAAWGFLPDCTSDEASIRQEIASIAIPPTTPIAAFYNTLAPTFRVPFERIDATYDPAHCASLARFFVEHETWQRETLIRNKAGTYADSPIFTKDPNLRYVSAARRAEWMKLSEEFTANVSPANKEVMEKFYALELKVTGLMEREGVQFLASTDDGGAIWEIPGFSLHQEFHELAAAGFSPLEVLQSTTLTAAQYLKTTATMGTVDEGKEADLVLLSCNPIESVDNLDRIAGVFNNGKYFSGTDLAKMKSDVAAAYAP